MTRIDKEWEKVLLKPCQLLLDFKATPAATTILVQYLISPIHNAQLGSVCTHLRHWVAEPLNCHER